MRIYYYVLAVTAAMLTITSCIFGDDANTLQFDVYMESWCPDTERFILNQVYPAWRALSDTGTFRVDFHSYGKASVSIYIELTVFFIISRALINLIT